MKGERKLRLMREIEASRELLLAVYRQNPDLLTTTEQRIRDLFAPVPGEANASARRGPPAPE